MKKVISILLVLVMALSLCACSTAPNAPVAGASNSPATIIDNEGNAVSMTAKELCDIYSENKAKFDKYYYGATINFTGTVESVQTGFRENGSSTTVDSIKFQEGWEVHLLHGWNNNILVELSKGTVIKVSSKIFSGFANTVDVRGMNSIGYTNDTLKETTLIIVE